MTESPEQALWCAVIQQAIADATASSKRERSRAIEWLLTPNRDFDHACLSAGLEPECVRARASKAINTAQPSKRRAASHHRAKRVYEHDGRSMSVAEWACEIGVAKATIYERLSRGMSLAEALTIGRHSRGVGRVLPQNASDRSTPITQDCA
jgi:hypothetical protein